MTRSRTAQVVLAGAALLCTSSASTAPSRSVEAAALPAGSVAVAEPEHLSVSATAVRSGVHVAPAVLAALPPPAASLTSSALPPVPVTLGRSGIPGRALAAYLAATQRLAAEDAACRLSWPLLAAIGFIESGHGSVHGASIGDDGRAMPAILGPRLDGNGFALIRDTDGGRLDGDTELDRAVGPMQFIPSTWARHAADGDGDGRADPHDLDDAALAAGRYLCTGPRRLDRPSSTIAAVFSYNHSYDYVRAVLTVAARYSGRSPESWGVGLLPAPSPAAEPSAEASGEASPEPEDGASPEPTSSPGDPAPSPESSSSPGTTPSPAESSPAAEPSPEGSEPEPSESAGSGSPEPSAEPSAAPSDAPGLAPSTSPAPAPTEEPTPQPSG